MKKFLLALFCLFIYSHNVQAQNDTILNINELLGGSGLLEICSNKYDRVVIYAAENCNDFCWWIDGNAHYENPLILDHNNNYHFGGNYVYCGINYIGCGINYVFIVRLYNPTTPTENTTTLWKRQNETITLEPVGVDSLNMYDFLWSNGEVTATIDVIEPGTYTCDISDMCATATRTFVVKDNVEIYRSTVDLETNKNKVTWQVTDEQAGYINQVKVERDGFVVGTAPYTDGFFLDNIGSENAARNYRVTGILHDGSECPIPSYQKGTLHVDYSPNASNPNKLNMAWTAPFIEEGAPLSVTYFQICKYDSNTHEITVIDQLGANNTIGSYDYSLFDGGYATVAALFSDAKDYENVSFSNLTEEILGVGEVCVTPFKIYPNPSQGNITVEGNGHLSVRNVLGQEIFTKEIEGLINLELSKGIYFVEMNGRTQKVVVE